MDAIVATERTVLRDVSLADGRVTDVVMQGGVVHAIGGRDAGADRVLDGAGGALLPGLHDHHCHLLAAAAAARSVNCGAPDVQTRAALLDALARAARGPGWVRGIGYDDASVGPLDRGVLDSAVTEVPVRVQDRSGALWVLNSAALAAVGAETADVSGIERDGAGRPTGRLWRLDAWLGERVGPEPPPDLAALGRELAALGITGVTDASPDLTAGGGVLLATLPQRVMTLGPVAVDGLTLGPRKIVVADHALPGSGELATTIREARTEHRAVAIHVLTRESILLALNVLADVGTMAGDRIEHAAVAPPESIQMMTRLRLRVVTQPSLVARRGDDYLARVDTEDLPHLWPYATLLAAGIPVGCSSDAPYGDLDPWTGIHAASTRHTPTRVVLGERERVPAAIALAGYLSSASRPGGTVRTVVTGMPADLVLLDAPLADVLADPRREHVRSTFIAGLST
jgi:predicted amidohydrolase YtcJ